MKFGSSEQNIKEGSIDYQLFGIKEIIKNTLVIATHGFVKKDQKVPQKEVDKAKKIRENYLK